MKRQREYPAAFRWDHRAMHGIQTLTLHTLPSEHVDHLLLPRLSKDYLV
jgi:hypothetical protein